MCINLFCSELDISRYQQTAFVTRDVFASSVLLFTYTSLLSWLVALGHSFRETRVDRQQREGLLRILSQNAIIPRITCICNYQFARLVNNVIMPLLILKSLMKRRASNSWFEHYYDDVRLFINNNVRNDIWIRSRDFFSVELIIASRNRVFS